MKNDIELRKVEDLAIAVAPRLPDEEGSEDFWDAYIINLKDEPIESVMIASCGYGEIEGEIRQTATFRHVWTQISPLDILKIEPLHKDVFVLAQEFWVSFTHDGYLYDRKFVFVPGSLEPAYFTEIPFLDRKGVMIR